jgi:hypothetical protein
MTPDTQTQQLVQQMRAAAEKATPGPWCAGHLADDDHPCNCTSIVCEGYAGAICRVDFDNGLRIGEGGNDAPPLEEAKANLRYIAAANPTNVLALIAALEAATARADAAEAKVRNAHGTMEQLFKAQCAAEDTAGTLPAKEAVKLVPRHWHKVMDGVRAVRAALASEASS